MTDILQLSALELAYKIKKRKFTVEDAVRAVYRRIEEREAELHCYISIRDFSEVLAEAKQIQARIDCGELTGPLAGIPIAVKDNICTQGLRTTCASRILEDFVPPYSATVIERLQTAGLIIIGKTNMDEFGMGSTTESSAFGITRNPHNPAHSPGGSSGGSCAAVAAGEAFLALGSDTGGSVRQPAAHCGVCGMKPTYGAVSRYGLIAYASSLDQIGPIGKTAEDCAALFDIIRGHDPKDATSLPDAALSPASFTNADSPTTTHPHQAESESTEDRTDRLTGLRIGIPNDLLTDASAVSGIPDPALSCTLSATGITPSVRLALRTICKRLQEHGAGVGTFSFGLNEYLLPSYYIIACAEASSNLARYDGVKYGYRTPADEPLHTMYRKTRSEGFGKEVQKRILLGTFTLSAGYYDAYYLKALKAKSKIVSRFEEIFADYDFLLLPVSASTAPELGAYACDPIAMYQSDLFTVPANLAGLPAITIPAGKDTSGLPIGLQLIGKRGSDYSLLQYASLLHAQGTDAR